MNDPIVSVAIANFNGAPFLEAAIGSVLAQDLKALEVLVIDNASTDDSVERAVRMAQADPRVRVERLAENRGPGGGRNRALELARGQWLAILDGDDLMHPSRLSRLLARAREDGADIVCDDLLVFSHDDPTRAERFLGPGRVEAPTWISPEDFLLETRIFSPKPNLGYLKPMVRLEAWRRAGVVYEETMPVAEDHDLLLRLITAGLRCRIDPFIGYFYRKHAASTSHRLRGSALARVAEAEARYRANLADPSLSLVQAMDAYRASILTAQAFTAAIEALKAGRAREALARLAQRPQAALLLRMPLEGLFRKLTGRRRPRAAAPEEPGAPKACFISRQRLVGRTNGSSGYLLDLAAAARRAGFEPHLVQPSPVVFGRWPVLRLRPEMKVFRSMAWRGALRVGPFVFSLRPGVYAAAILGVIAKALERLKLPSEWLGSKPAPYAAAAAWSDEDRLFVARTARAKADALIADYAWQTEAFPYALRPDARRAVIMHDLFHLRAGQFRQAAASDSTALLDRQTERDLLGRADVVLAIQKAEAEEVARLLPRRRVIVAPMTAEPAAAAQPGDSAQILFVGSNTAPNILGLSWLFESVWPAVRAAAPDARLMVAGNVSRALPPPPEGVRYLGVVDRLDRLYAEAGVVISPLTVGSGLKVKLVEAMAHGKACVVTSVTLQGVVEEAGDAVALADAPDEFAAAIVRLLSNPDERLELGARALAAVRASFSAEQAHGEFAAWLTGAPAGEADAPLLEAQPAA